MHKLLVSTLAALVYVAPAIVAPALAQEAPAPAAPAAPQEQASKGANPDQPGSPSPLESIGKTLQTQLARAGFTDIEMVPTSFLIHAKDADGHPVMLMLSPESVTQFQDDPQDGEGGDSGLSAIPGQQKF